MSETRPLMDRLWNRSEELPSGCWVWRGALNHEGYGYLKIVGQGTRRTHRAAYEEVVGPIPPGMQIDHLCRTRACWRPDHLEVVTPAQNTLRAPDQVASNNARKTHCLAGHELSGPNLITRTRRGRPARECRACRNMNRNARRRAKRSICGAPCPHGGLSATRKRSHSDLGWMGHCNRPVPNNSDRCWQHAGVKL